MAPKQGEELEGDITFIKTPPQPPAKFATAESCGVATTKVSSFPNPLTSSIGGRHSRSNSIDPELQISNC
jgi:hypothetical protein